MKADGDKPRIGNSASSLGVRVGRDTFPDQDGNVGPDSGGMSVAPTLESLPPMFVPRRLESQVPAADGPKNVVCWVMGEGPFEDGPVTEDLILKVDGPTHGELLAARLMTLKDYQTSIARTQGVWTNGE